MEYKILISIKEKTGFFCKGHLKIYDEEKKLFYNFEPKNNKLNLPKGKYFTNCNLKRLYKPLIFNLPKLPKKERNDLKSVFLVVSKNNSTASIYSDTGKIVVDREKFLSIGKLERDFIFLHEIGHFFYDKEVDADLFATVQMLKIGYNPSQTIQAAAGTLRPNEKNFKRCTHLINELTK